MLRILLSQKRSNGPCFLSALGIVNALGAGAGTVATRLFAGDSRQMISEDGWLPGSPVRVGRVQAALPEISPELSAYESRASRLLLAAFEQIRGEVDEAIGRFGPARIGIVLGTSTSGIDEGEAAIAAQRKSGALPPGYRYARQELGAPALFLAQYLGVTGPAFCVSTACTSSAKALVSARGLLRLGLCDAVITGGVDALCKLTVNGFAALGLVSPSLCKPMSHNRDGINIGEGAALFLMTREAGKGAKIALLGAGESSDAYHSSAPHPDGIGAASAMRAALADAGLETKEVDYLNLHATATKQNDAMESLAVSHVFPDGVAASGAKAMTGHTLGAAGATELAFCWLALCDGRLPPHVWDGKADPTLPRLDLVEKGRRFARGSGRACLSNSFAFGGNNVCLLIGDPR
jgi:3-oxoacyl-[acyl-carrier-protein] synthase-1